MGEEFLTSVGAFARFIAHYVPQQTDFTFWYVVLDESRIRFDRVDDYTLGAQRAQLKAQRILPQLQVDRSPIEPLKEVQIRTRILKQLLLGFSLPVLALVLFFVGLIATLTVRYQENEVAILISRGASRLQVVGISALEGMIFMALGTPLGVVASLTFARAMSQASGFLAFGRSDPLPVTTYALDWRLVAVALVVSLLARLFPALSAARRTIVTYGHERARPGRLNVALKVLLMFFLVVATGYAWYRLSARGTLGLVSFEPGSGVTNDPLVFLAPTLFLFAVSLVSAQCFPFFMQILDIVGRNLPSTTLFLGLRNLARESGTYTIPLFLVITCLCLGSFEGSIARSADVWLVDRWHYRVGADYSFQQIVGKDPSGVERGENAWLLPVDSYRTLPGVTDATRVGVYRTFYRTNRSETKLTLLGVDRLDFPRVAYFRDDYAPVSLGELLNRLGAQPSGILVTPKFLGTLGLNIGDTLPLDVMVQEETQHIEFTVVGTFDEFPTVYESQSTAVVANLDFVFDQFGGIFPHSIWLRTTPDMGEGNSEGGPVRNECHAGGRTQRPRPLPGRPAATGTRRHIWQPNSGVPLRFGIGLPGDSGLHPGRVGGPPAPLRYPARPGPQPVPGSGNPQRRIPGGYRLRHRCRCRGRLGHGTLVRAILSVHRRPLNHGSRIHALHRLDAGPVDRRWLLCGSLVGRADYPGQSNASEGLPGATHGLPRIEGGRPGISLVLQLLRSLEHERHV